MATNAGGKRSLGSAEFPAWLFDLDAQDFRSSGSAVESPDIQVYAGACDRQRGHIAHDEAERAQLANNSGLVLVRTRVVGAGHLEWSVVVVVADYGEPPRALALAIIGVIVWHECVPPAATPVVRRCYYDNRRV